MKDEERLHDYLNAYRALKLTSAQIRAAEEFRAESEADLVKRYGPTYLVENHARLLREMKMIAYELPGAPREPSDRG